MSKQQRGKKPTEPKPTEIEAIRTDEQPSPEPLPYPRLEPFPADINAAPTFATSEPGPETEAQSASPPAGGGTAVALSEDPEGIPVYRRCPLCWGRSKGVGIAYSTQGFTRYYKCKRTLSPDHPPCGFTWSAIVKLDVLRVEHRDIDLEMRGF